MLLQAFAIANGKGGVGKTSLTANIAAIAAYSGWDVLVVDLDPQGNLGVDLGYRQIGMSDEGAALSRSIQFGDELKPPVIQIRPHLDAIPGGHLTRDLARVLLDRGKSEAASAADAAFAPLVGRYDLIIFDCPPGDDVLGDLGLALSRGLVVPIRFDAGSLDGLELMANRVSALRTSGINRVLSLVGIAIFDFNPQATALRRQLETELSADFLQGVRIFDTAIRHSQRAAFDMRMEGIVSIEYEAEADVERMQRLQLLKTDREQLAELGPAKSTSARGLAEDYSNLANEILDAFTNLETVRGGSEIILPGDHQPSPLGAW